MKRPVDARRARSTPCLAYSIEHYYRFVRKAWRWAAPGGWVRWCARERIPSAIAHASYKSTADSNSSTIACSELVMFGNHVFATAALLAGGS